MVTGSCLCRAVRFEVEPQGIVASVACQCDNCRKVSGSQFGVYLQVREAAFRLVAGTEHIATYESSPGNQRAFCGVCGSVAPIRTHYGAVRVPAGAFDEDPGIEPGVLIFSGRKKSWCDAGLAERRFDDTGPSEMWRDMVMRLHGTR